MNADFEAWAARCPERLTPSVEPRRGNVIAIEIGTPAPRCVLKEPEHWPNPGAGRRWLASGGSPLVFGRCSESCPRLK